MYNYLVFDYSILKGNQVFRFYDRMIIIDRIGKSALKIFTRNRTEHIILKNYQITNKFVFVWVQDKSLLSWYIKLDFI